MKGDFAIRVFRFLSERVEETGCISNCVFDEKKGKDAAVVGGGRKWVFEKERTNQFGVVWGGFFLIFGTMEDT